MLRAGCTLDRFQRTAEARYRGMMRIVLDDIVTSRLVLRLIGAESTASCLAADIAEASLLIGAAIPEELLEQPAVLRYNENCLRADALYRPWSARAIILRQERRMIGHIRFHGRPGSDDAASGSQPWAAGAIEFGILLFAGDRARGYATEAVNAVMDWATRTAGFQRFVASVSPGNLASLRLIARLGFVKVGEQIDDIDGLEHIFLRG